MLPRCAVLVGVALGFLLMGGCSASVSNRKTERHEGPKVNLADFSHNTPAYKGKTITLGLKIDEPIAQDRGQSLRDYVGRYVRFTASGPKGERVSLVIRIPSDLTVPEVGNSDEVRVTFVCTQGDLRQGNLARSIERL
jgi:hypothetical protein